MKKSIIWPRSVVLVEIDRGKRIVVFVFFIGEEEEKKDEAVDFECKKRDRRAVGECVRVVQTLGSWGCALETQSGTVTNNLRRRFYWPSLGWSEEKRAHSNRLRVAELEKKKKEAGER